MKNQKIVKIIKKKKKNTDRSEAEPESGTVKRWYESINRIKLIGVWRLRLTEGVEGEAAKLGERKCSQWPQSYTERRKWKGRNIGFGERIYKARVYRRQAPLLFDVVRFVRLGITVGPNGIFRENAGR